jgi:hypothetical protein
MELALLICWYILSSGHSRLQCPVCLQAWHTSHMDGSKASAKPTAMETTPNPYYSSNCKRQDRPPFRAGNGRREPSMWDVCHACRQTGHWRRECPLLKMYQQINSLILDDPDCSSVCLTDFLLILGVGGNDIRLIFSNSGPTSSRCISNAY